jgi:hypothetical protein
MEEQTIINKTEKPNSYEFGKAGRRFKVYFEDTGELNRIINGLIDAGYVALEDDPRKT